MTQNYSTAAPQGTRTSGPRPSPLSLRQTVPTGWHQDRTAFAGDPDFDWESVPEAPREPRWGITEVGSRRKGQA